MKYRITDQVSGKTLVISGDKPPTEQEAEELFGQSGIRQPAQTQPQQNLLQKAAGVMAPISAALMPDVVNIAQRELQKVGAGDFSVQPPSLREVGAEAFGPIGTFLLGSERQKERTKAAAETAGTLQGVLGIAGGVNSAAQGVGNVVKGAVATKSLSPIKIASFLRTQAANKAGDITTTGLIKAGEEYVKLNPLAKDTWDVFKPAISEKMPTTELLKQMSTVFGNAYSKGGSVRDTAQAQLMNELYQAGKTAISQQAPEVAKYTGGMRQILSAPGNLQKLTWLAAKLGLARGAF